MLVFGRVSSLLTSLAVVYLSIGPNLGMTLSDDQRDKSTMMAPVDDQLELTSQMSATGVTQRRYTENREIQEHINQLFTYAGQTLPTRSSGRSAPTFDAQEVPRCAAERAYCTEQEAGITDDISEAVNQLLGSNPTLRLQFNATDVLTQEDKKIVDRAPDAKENDLCGFKVELTRVTWATSESNVLMRIAQSENFVQAVRLEHCTDQNCGCHTMFTSGLPGRYVARCKQKYVYRQLLAVTEEGKKKLKLVPNTFRLPSCCSCVITKQLNLSDGGEECEKDKHGLKNRDSPKEDSPPQNENTNTNTASRHSLRHVTFTTIIFIISFRYLHFK